MLKVTRIVTSLCEALTTNGYKVPIDFYENIKLIVLNEGSFKGLYFFLCKIIFSKDRDTWIVRFADITLQLCHILEQNINIVQLSDFSLHLIRHEHDLMLLLQCSQIKQPARTEKTQCFYFLLRVCSGFSQCCSCGCFMLITG